MSVLILLKLFFAHIVADFPLQPDAICKGKTSNKQTTKWKYLSLHAAIHSVVTYVVVAEWEVWALPVAVFVAHFLIDFLKTRTATNKLKYFVLDQLLHIASLVLITFLWFGDGNECFTSLFENEVDATSFWLLLVAYLLVLQPSSILLSLFIKKWEPHNAGRSLPNAGKWIGYLERCLILTFILVGSLESVGFLLAAKSVFRFGELSKAQEIRTTEYVLIGTLASFAIAIFIGLIALQLLQNQ